MHRARYMCLCAQDVLQRGGKVLPLYDRVTQADAPAAIVVPAAPAQGLQVLGVRLLRMMCTRVCPMCTPTHKAHCNSSSTPPLAGRDLFCSPFLKGLQEVPLPASAAVATIAVSTWAMSRMAGATEERRPELGVVPRTQQRRCRRLPAAHCRRRRPNQHPVLVRHHR